MITLVSCFTSGSYSRRLLALTRPALFDVILSRVSAREHFYLSNVAITLFLRFLSPLFFHSCLWKTPFPTVPLVDRAADLSPLPFSRVSPENYRDTPSSSSSRENSRRQGRNGNELLLFRSLVEDDSTYIEQYWQQNEIDRATYSSSVLL